MIDSLNPNKEKDSLSEEENQNSPSKGQEVPQPYDIDIIPFSKTAFEKETSEENK